MPFDSSTVVRGSPEDAVNAVVGKLSAMPENANLQKHIEPEA
jgi:hypothetical protein